MALILDRLIPKTPESQISLTLALTAEERRRSHQRLELSNGTIIHLQLPRGTVLHSGDLLQGNTPDIIVKIIPKAEEVVTVKSNNYLDLIKAAYHLGNRHIPLEITRDYLRFSADTVLADMVKRMGLQVIIEIQNFEPESGAYKHEH
jgi:urease accessory protein